MKTLYLNLFIVGLTLSGYGQSALMKVADKKYDSYAYIDAITIYEKVANKGFKSVDLFQKLGNAYFLNGELKQAAKWYRALFDLNEVVEAEYYFRYALTLKAVENIEQSNYYMTLFQEKTIDSRGSMFAETKNNWNALSSDSKKYTLFKTSINSKNYDYGPVFYGDQIVFTSSRSEGNQHSKIHNWTKQNFTDLFVATIDSLENLENVSNFSSEINTKFNESSPTFTKDGKTMYFTRNNYHRGEKRKSKDKITVLEKIYRAEFSNNRWTNITELPFCSDDYRTAHPALSPDEKTLFFASDRPGSLGGSDLYKVSILSNGSFGIPENLGPSINTEGRETFPFIDAYNTLFFASDGHPGLGGLDIFESACEHNQYTKVTNIGYPINSTTDDFGYVSRNNTGYFSSNREGGSGFDDVYGFKKCEITLNGIIKDIDSQKVISNSKIILSDENNYTTTETFSTEDGHFTVQLACSKNYIITVIKEAFEPIQQTISTKEIDEKLTVDFSLKQLQLPITTGTDLAKVLNIQQIYFDLDQWNIRPDAALELEKIIAVMQQYPNMIVAIRSHTDSRQSEQYNAILSEKRALSTLAYIAANGIERNRLTAKGYGETQLINECADSIPCSEEAHQKNRRSEFIIIKM